MDKFDRIFQLHTILLRIPYKESRELVMDIMRHGGNVEVLAPEDLRLQVRDALEIAAAQYR